MLITYFDIIWYMKNIIKTTHVDESSVKNVNNLENRPEIRTLYTGDIYQ